MKNRLIIVNFMLLGICIGVFCENEISSWTIILGDDGTLEVIDSDKKLEDSDSSLSELEENVIFYLYTKSNMEDFQKISIYDDSIKKSYFNSSNPTRIVIHGWKSSSNELIGTSIRDAYLSQGDYNVILIDWGSYASENYLQSRAKIVTVGKYVGLFIDLLQKNGADLDEFILIGHSLGAHVAGVAGRNSINHVGIIVALDPAGPLFYLLDLYARLRPTDANFVQVIHTSGGSLGHNSDLGDVDIWVNGGSKQSGCGLDIFRTCAHGRSHIYFAESIANKNKKSFLARICDSYSSYVNGNCDSNDSTYLGGIDIDTNAKPGKYFLTTNSKPTYAKN